MDWLRSLTATKSIEQLHAESASTGHHALKRVLGPLQLVMLGIGDIIGAGIFVLAGLAAAQDAGGDSAVVRARRDRLQFRGALLCRVRRHAAGVGLGVHLRLRDARRAGRVDHRLRADARVRGRPVRRGGRLVRLRDQPAARLRRDRAAGVHRAARHGPRRNGAAPLGDPVQRRRPTGGAGHRPDDAGPPDRGLQPPGCVHRAGDDGGPRRRHPGVRARQRRHRRHQGVGHRRLHCGGRRVRADGELDAVRAPEHRRIRPLRLLRHRPRRGRRLLRVHGLRLRDDRRTGDEAPAAGPADRHFRLAGRLRGALHPPRGCTDRRRALPGTERAGSDCRRCGRHRASRGCRRSSSSARSAA